MDWKDIKEELGVVLRDYLKVGDERSGTCLVMRNDDGDLRYSALSLGDTRMCRVLGVMIDQCEENIERGIPFGVTGLGADGDIEVEIEEDDLDVEGSDEVMYNFIYRRLADGEERNAVLDRDGDDGCVYRITHRSVLDNEEIEHGDLYLDNGNGLVLWRPIV